LWIGVHPCLSPGIGKTKTIWNQLKPIIPTGQALGAMRLRPLSHDKNPRTQSQTMARSFCTDGRLVFFISHRIDVWNIYRSIDHKFLVNVGIYSTMDPMDIYGFCFLQQLARAEDVFVGGHRMVCHAAFGCSLHFPAAGPVRRPEIVDPPFAESEPTI